MRKIKKGDDVVVTTGRDKGKRGTVLRVVDPSTWWWRGSTRCKKHQRPNPMKDQTGGIVDKEMPIHVSNVAIFNPQTKKADRVGFNVMEDGRKVRVFKSNGERSMGEESARERRPRRPKRRPPRRRRLPKPKRAARRRPAAPAGDGTPARGLQRDRRPIS